jgi:hypothetical protein
VHGQAGRPGKTALTYESYPHNSTDFAPRTRGVKDLFRNPIWKLFRLSRISCRASPDPDLYGGQLAIAVPTVTEITPICAVVSVDWGLFRLSCISQPRMTTNL